MARPCKPAKLLTDKSQTKAELSEREQIEKKLRGSKTKITCPSDLTSDQKKIFRRIVKELGDKDILGSLDNYLLRQTAIAIDRLHTIEDMINGNHNYLFNAKLMAAKDKYTKDFFRCCNELGLSPQSRAKFANLMSAKAEDPLIAALTEDDDEEEDEE
ncbi:MAG: P27 family phage terminase small subunit [Ruminococcus sp.]|nr:P27 family phage terminase small subunit [Ruminococcus sp.]